MSSVKQNKDHEIRYTKNKDFTDEIAKEFLERNLQLNADSFSYPELLNPIFWLNEIILKISLFKTRNKNN